MVVGIQRTSGFEYFTQVNMLPSFTTNFLSFYRFTGFITRMRGYHSVRDKLPGHENGALPNTHYYVPTAQRNVMHKYSPLHGPFFNREFPTSWRQLDFDLGLGA